MGVDGRAGDRSREPPQAGGRWHSGFPGGLSSTSYTELLDKDPRKAVEKAVRGMLPKNSLARQQLSKLKVYAGSTHPHEAQKPVPFVISQVAQ